MPARDCIYCGGRKLAPAHTRADGRRTVTCRDCGLQFLADRPSDIAQLYRDDYFGQPAALRPDPTQPMVDIGYATYGAMGPLEFRWQQALLRLFVGQPGAEPRSDATAPRLLDLGCARGDFLALARSDGFDTEGVELIDSAAQHARRQGLRVRSQALETLDGLSPYDVVTAWEFIEHVPDLRGALAQIRALLPRRGLFLFSTPDAGAADVVAQGDRWIGYRSSMEHLTYLDRDFMDRALTQIFGSKPLLLSFQVPSRDDLYSTLVGIARVGGLTKRDRQIGEQLAARDLPSRTTQPVEYAWIYNQFHCLRDDQLDAATAKADTDDLQALKAVRAFQRGDVTAALPGLVQASHHQSWLWQLVAMDLAQQSDIKADEHRRALAATQQSLRMQAEAQRQRAQARIEGLETHLQAKGKIIDEIHGSLSWKIGRGVTFVPDLLISTARSAAHLYQTPGPRGVVALGLDGLRRGVSMRMAQLPLRLPTLWQRALSTSGAVLFFARGPWVPESATPPLGLEPALSTEPSSGAAASPQPPRAQAFAQALARLGFLVVFDESTVAEAADPQDVSRSDLRIHEQAQNLFRFHGASRSLCELPAPIVWTTLDTLPLHTLASSPHRVVCDLSGSVIPSDGDLRHSELAPALTDADVLLLSDPALHARVLQLRPDALLLPDIRLDDEAGWVGALCQLMAALSRPRSPLEERPSEAAPAGLAEAALAPLPAAAPGATSTDPATAQPADVLPTPAPPAITSAAGAWLSTARSGWQRVRSPMWALLGAARRDVATRLYHHIEALQQKMQVS